MALKGVACIDDAVERLPHRPEVPGRRPALQGLRAPGRSPGSDQAPITPCHSGWCDPRNMFVTAAFLGSGRAGRSAEAGCGAGRTWIGSRSSCSARSRNATSASCGCGSPTCSATSSRWPSRRPSWRARSPRASGSTVRRSRASPASTSPTWSRGRIRRRSRCCRGRPRTGEHYSARMFCDIAMPDGSPSWADPRHVLRRALSKAAEAGFTCYVHPEIEFYLLRDLPADGSAADAGRQRRLLRPVQPRRGAALPAQRDRDARVDGHLRRVQPPRGRARASRRSTCATPTRSRWPTTS